MGLLRLFLALCVVADHAQSDVLGLPRLTAFFAVNFFFIISGFYMALVLNGKYRDAPVRDFYRNRVVRLFPVYYVGLAIAVVVSFDQIVTFFLQLPVVSQAYYLVSNLFMVGQDLPYTLCLPSSGDGCVYAVAMTANPPAWSLAVELGFYLVAPFIVKSPRRTYFFILFGALYLLALVPLAFPTGEIFGLGSRDESALSYFFYPASFIFFGLGALAYQLSAGIARPRFWPGVVLLVILVPTSITMEFWQPMLFAFAVSTLFRYTKDFKVDRLIGELSYPVYILHFPILLAMTSLAADNPGLTAFLSLGSLVGVICIVLGLALHFTVERISTRWRAPASQGAEPTPAVTAAAPIENPGSRPAPGRLVRTGRRAVIGLYLAVPVAVVVLIAVTQVTTPATRTLEVSDSMWTNGVAQAEAAIVVADTIANRGHFAEGSTVTFESDDARTIREVRRVGGRLEVHFSGAPIATGEGFPQRFSVEPPG